MAETATDVAADVADAHAKIPTTVSGRGHKCAFPLQDPQVHLISLPEPWCMGNHSARSLCLWRLQRASSILLLLR